MGERRGTKGLELWCRKMTEGYPGVKIDNMTTSWRDGLAFCAIIHHFRPDLIDFEKLNKDDIYHNNELAFRVAEQYLGIPALLEPEDMVEYSVPDRLSILTYLSQFYQAFAVPQGSSAARIAAKRPQTSTDHGIVSPTSTSPPSKVAFTGAGRIRREPCAKCSLPVFIAERLNVGKLLYHRTCFRCARCNSQLTLANYYETENGEFCCEICPDEERVSRKSSPEKSVLFRSMSDEEKTASLKTFSNEPDDYSAMFETALESIKDDAGLKTELTLSRGESFKARCNFFQSQLEDSGTEEEPPDLPKSLPPKLDKSELGSNEDTLNSKDSVNASGVNSDSGFPTNKLDTTVNIDSSSKPSLSNQFSKASVELDKTHNIVTKDKSATEGDTSLVKARMRLFEINKSTDVIEFRKSDLRKNPQNDKPSITPVKSPARPNENVKSTSIPIVKLDDLENFDQLSKKDFKYDSNLIDDNKISDKKDVISPSIKDSSKLSNDDDISDKYSGEKSKIEIRDEGKIAPVSKELVSDKEDIDKQEKDVMESPSLDSKESDLKNDTKTLDNSTEDLEDSVITILDSSDESKKSVITVEDSPLSNLSTTMEDTPSSTITIESSDDSKHQTADVGLPDPSSKITDLKPQHPSQETSFKPPPVPKETEDDLEENYPGELNPFGDEEMRKEDKGEKADANTSLNPFEDDEDEDDEAVVKKPVPSPRVRRKLLPADNDKRISGTPEHLSRVYIQRISVNPFESEDEEPDKTDPNPPMPATRKKKVIAAPKISLNPFWSEDEEVEDADSKQPVPKPRILRSSLGVPEPKPRETGGLSLSTRSNFGSNSSISSGSVYGSARKKKPAPRPPIPFIRAENQESATSSVTSSPCHSVQHSPRLTPKYRKSKRAPPPPSSSTPIPPHKELLIDDDRLSYTALSPIKLDSTESQQKDIGQRDAELAEDDIEEEKNVKDEMNRSKQSQNVGLPSPTSSENSSIISPPNKSTYGKWKRRKGQAPTRPIPQKRTIKCLPMTEIRRELDVIEIQQQGLERQGVRLEQIIREKCEGADTHSVTTEDNLPIDVEDLILQLFELVNEKNELFRKQAELMYLRRQQRLEEEHADVEYQIRCLMLQPEANKTDSDKAREEELINRLVEIVERRNEIIECLEMDRVREAEEDDSINNHINLYTLKRDGEKEPEKLAKEMERTKKKQKKEKKSKYKIKGHKIDADKDIDESESYSTLEKKKKKKFNIF